MRPKTATRKFKSDGQRFDAKRTPEARAETLRRRAIRNHKRETR